MAKISEDVKKSAEEVVEAAKDARKKVNKQMDKIVDYAEKTSEEVAEEWEETFESIGLSAKKTEKKAKTAAKGMEEAWSDSGKKVETIIGDIGKDDITINVNFDKEGAKKKAKTLMGNVKDVFKEKASAEIPVVESINKYTEGLSGATGIAVGAVIGIATEAVAGADKMDKAMNKFLSSTGKGEEETERFQTVLENIYRKGYGENFDDIASSMVKVTHVMGDMDDKALEEIVESAYAIQKAFGFDVSDSVKAAQKLMKQYGLTSEEAMNLLTIGAQSGLTSTDELLGKVGEYASSFEDAKIGADDLFGMFGEDVDSAGEKLDRLKETQSDSLSSMFERIKNSIDLLLVPLGESLMPLLEVLMEAILPVINELLVPLIELFALLLEPIVNLIQEALTPLIDVFLMLMDEAINPLIELVEEFLVPLFLEEVQRMVPEIEKVIGNIKKHFSLIIDFVKNIFAGNWKAAWQNIKDIFKNMLEGLGNYAKIPLNNLIDMINVLINGLNKIKIPDWVPVIGGKNLKIPKMERLKVGIDYVPSDFFPAFLDEGEAVLTKEENALFRSLGGLEGMIQLSGSQYPDVFRLQTESTPIIIHSHVNLDGKEVGNSITKYVDSNLSENENMRWRGN